MELFLAPQPIKRNKLIQFLDNLQKQTATHPSTGETLKFQGNTLWVDLPSFGYTETETWYGFGGDYTGKISL